MQRNVRLIVAAVSLTVCVVIALPAGAQSAASPTSYMRCRVGILRVKLHDPKSGGATEAEVRGASASFTKLVDTLATHGDVVVLGRFESSLFEAEPARLEALRDVIVVRPASFEDERYEMFQTEQVGSSLVLTGVQAGSPGEYSLTVNADVSSVVAWMRDGNPIILAAAVHGTCLARKGESVVFSALVPADQYEYDRAPLTDFASGIAGSRTAKCVAYQILIVVSLMSS